MFVKLDISYRLIGVLVGIVSPLFSCCCWSIPLMHALITFVVISVFAPVSHADFDVGAAGLAAGDLKKAMVTPRLTAQVLLQSYRSRFLFNGTVDFKDSAYLQYSQIVSLQVRVATSAVSLQVRVSPSLIIHSMIHMLPCTVPRVRCGLLPSLGWL